MQGAWHSRLSRISLQSTFSAWLSHFQLSLSYHHPVYWFMCVYLLACTNTNPAYWLPPAQNLLHSPNHKSFLPPLNIHSKYSVSLWYRWSCFYVDNFQSPAKHLPCVLYLFILFLPEYFHPSVLWAPHIPFLNQTRYLLSKSLFSSCDPHLD